MCDDADEVFALAGLEVDGQKDQQASQESNAAVGDRISHFVSIKSVLSYEITRATM